MSTPPSNQRIVFTAPGVAEIEPCTTPAAGAGHLLICTRATLISPGTERAFFLGLPNTPQHYPNYPGYSNIGEVLAVGEGVSGWAVGQRVANTAGHAALVQVAANTCAPVPAGLDDVTAVFFNLAAIALQGVRRARIELGEPVAVIGAGLIGLLALQLARLQGGLPVLAIDPDPHRLAFAQRVGADQTLPPAAELADQVAQASNGDGPAVVIEATGHPEAILTAFALARPGGRVVLLGSTRGETEAVNFYRDVHRKGLTIYGAHNNARPRHDSAAGLWTALADQQVALALLARGRLHVQTLITHHLPWHQAVTAYDRLKQWDTTTLGMVLDWSESR